MAFKSIRLQNFKGFKDAKLELKPLTVILGPNSAGKSSFGQALVALSKNNLSRDRIVSLAFDQKSPFNLGSYSSLVHEGCKGEPVMIELEVNSGTLKLGFGGSISLNKITNIGELDLTYIEVGEKLNYELYEISSLPIDTDQTIKSPLPIGLNFNQKDIETNQKFNRLNKKNWRIKAKGIEADYKIFFDGLNIEGVSHLSGTSLKPSDIFSVIPFQDTASLLEKISYLRPDRTAPLREYKNSPHSRDDEIDDSGDGAIWYIHAYGETLVDTFSIPHPTSDTGKAEKILSEVALQKKENKKLINAVADWLTHLGLAASFETKLINGGQTIQALATPPEQTIARPLTDIGFGVSQALPILIKGFTVKENGLFVVEQPEAQLHPKPQAELADFFCSMVKCGRNVLVETHSVELFHRLRLRAAMDEDLAEKIGVYFLHEPENGICCEPVPISLKEEFELNWPKGFLPEGIQQEMEILAMRLARRNKKN